MDSPYCFPVSAGEMVLRLRTARDDVKSVTLIYENKYDFYRMQRRIPMEKAYAGVDFDWYEVRLRLVDTRLAYIFYVEDENGGCYFSEDGASGDYDFSRSYYNFFQYPYINESDIVYPVEWMKNAVFYQIFVDRFRMADKEKDRSYIDMTWGGEPTPWSHAGGDLQGITGKLGYIHKLGCNTVYLTPVFKSLSNHKYDIIDYYSVDEQFGSAEDLKVLVEQAHKLGMRVVLDAVFNHASEDIAQFVDCREKGRDSEYYDWFIIKGDRVDRKKCNYEVFGFCEYMPKWNTSNPKVHKYLIDIATYYIREFDIDGWRLDVSDEISRDFWREFRKAVKAEKQDCAIIGENWHDASAYLRGDQYDSIMNYAFSKAMLDYFMPGGRNALETSQKLNSLLVRNKEGVNRMMLNLLDSHDVSRFYTDIGCDRKKMKQALAALYFYQGAPCIYYGTEVLMEGGYDPDCRRCMPWERTRIGKGYEDIANLIRALAGLKKRARLNDGIFRVTSEDDVLVMRYTVRKKEYCLFINNSDMIRRADGFMIPKGGFLITENGQIILKDI